MSGQENPQALMRRIAAENIALIAFAQAVIATHHSPRVLLQAFNLAHDQFMGAFLADPLAKDATLDALQEQRDLIAGQIERRLAQMQSSAQRPDPLALAPWPDFSGADAPKAPGSTGPTSAGSGTDS